MNLSKIASTVVLTATLLLALGAHAVDKETILYNFNSTSSGGWQPYGGVFWDQLCNFFLWDLYGVNATGGSSGLGYVFELSPNSGGSWTLTHLHDFGGGDGAGGAGASGQVGGLIMDASGNLFGTTFAGGASTQCASGCGVVFKLKNNSGIWTETVLHSFKGSNGSNPAAPLLMDAAGNLYGTTTSG